MDNRKFSLERESTSHNEAYFTRNGKKFSIDEIPPNTEILAMAKEYDQENSRRKQKYTRKRMAYVAVLVAVICLAVTTMSLEPTNALKATIYRIFSNEGNGSVTLIPDKENNFVGTWEDYWYPTYIPEGFSLEAAEKTEYESIMFFASNSMGEIRILENPLDMATTMDTDHNNMEKVTVGHYRGYLFTSEEYKSITILWATDDRQICIEWQGGMDKEAIKEIADGMVYVEN